MERATDSARFRQELDNHITGHGGEDFFTGEDEQPENLTFQFTVTMTREEADTLAEFLHTMLNDMMKIETIVFYTKDKEATSDEQQKQS